MLEMEWATHCNGDLLCWVINTGGLIQSVTTWESRGLGRLRHSGDEPVVQQRRGVQIVAGARKRVLLGVVPTNTTSWR